MNEAKKSSISAKTKSSKAMERFLLSYGIATGEPFCVYDGFTKSYIKVFDNTEHKYYPACFYFSNNQELHLLGIDAPNSYIDNMIFEVYKKILHRTFNLRYRAIRSKYVRFDDNAKDSSKEECSFCNEEAEHDESTYKYVLYEKTKDEMYLICTQTGDFLAPLMISKIDNEIVPMNDHIEDGEYKNELTAILTWAYNKGRLYIVDEINETEYDGYMDINSDNAMSYILA